MYVILFSLLSFSLYTTIIVYKVKSYTEHNIK